jgi:hemerythrin-like domain-containing protein
MNVVLFAAALDTVEQDHQLVLDRVEALKELVVALMTPGELDVPQVFGRLREIDNYFVTQLAVHMDEEEKSLFPLLEQLPPEGPALAERLRQEHTTLRRKLDDFSNCLAVALELQDRPPRVVLRDLLTYGWELWELLDRHELAETQGIHECLERHLRDNPAA